MATEPSAELLAKVQMELEKAHAALRRKKTANKKLYARLLAAIQERDETLAARAQGEGGK